MSSIARSATALLAALLISVAVAASAFGADMQGTGKDSAGDGLAGADRDIVSTSFAYADSGALELTVTMAAPIDTQHRSTAVWTLSEGPANHDCGKVDDGPSSSQVRISYDTAGLGSSARVGVRALPQGTARISGATLVYDIADSALAGHAYACLVTNVESTRGDPQGANISNDPGDIAPAAAAGFTFPGPIVSLLESGKSVEATDLGSVRLSFSSFAYDAAKVTVTLRTAHKVRLTKSSPRTVSTIATVDGARLTPGGNVTHVKVRLTKKGLAFLKRSQRVATIATVAAEDAQGRTSKSTFRLTLESPPA